jgi:hypothetical protein
MDTVLIPTTQLKLPSKIKPSETTPLKTPLPPSPVSQQAPQEERTNMIKSEAKITQNFIKLDDKRDNPTTLEENDEDGEDEPDEEQVREPILDGRKVLCISFIICR